MRAPVNVLPSRKTRAARSVPRIPVRVIRTLALAAIVFASWGLRAAPLDSPEQRAEARVLVDLVDVFSTAALSGHSAVGGGTQSSDGVALPGVFLHPPARGETRATWTLSLPDAQKDTRLLLLFQPGFRDTVPWEEPGANGAIFRVRVDDETLHEEQLRGPGWSSRAVALDRFAGQKIQLTLSTDADGNSSWDHAVFGRPLLVEVHGTTRRESLRAQAPGLALLDIVAGTLAEIRVTVDGRSQRMKLPVGRHSLALDFASVTPPDFEVLSGTARVEASAFALWPAQVDVETIELSSPLVFATETFDALVRVRNRGLGASPAGSDGDASESQPLELRIHAPDADAMRAIVLPRLEPGETKTLPVRDIAIHTSGETSLTCAGATRRFHVFPRDPGPLSSGDPETLVVAERHGEGFRARVADGAARLDLVVDPHGEAFATLSTFDSKTWHRAGSVHPLAALATRSGTRSFESRLHVDEVSAIHEDRTLLISGSLETANGARVSARIEISTLAAPPLSFQLEARSETPLEVLALRGPDLLVGDRAFGSRHDFALFPGLEYLERGEASSSTRDLAWPLSDRHVPALHKITWPLIAIECDEQLVSLRWTDSWTEGQEGLATYFDAPDEESGIRTHRVQVFAPAVGKHLHENSLLAHTPVSVEAGARMQIAVDITLDHAGRYLSRREASEASRDGSDLVGTHPGALLLQSLRHVFKSGPPDPAPAPREFVAERALSREAYLGILWREEPPGFSHCGGWSHGPFSGHLVPLHLDRLGGVEPTLAAELLRRETRLVDHVVATRGADALWRGDACHIVLGELPYLVGHLPESLRGLHAHARRLLDARRDGLWRWQPASPKHASLGRAGDHVSGTAAHPAWVVLRAARLTGDPQLGADALEALEQLDRYSVPRGAQTWECPLYQPDILASAYAVRAYCEAYRLTGNVKYLDRARYWAWTGLPFLYVWQLEGVPSLQYNSIAVFGSTFHTHSWLGLPVVWCGLVYAYALQDLALFDASFDWKKVAEGVTRSAKWQQYTTGPHRGLYPDSWSIEENAPRPADINPENILLNEFRLHGPSPHIRHAALRADGRTPVHVNSSADIVDARLDSTTAQLEITLRSVRREAAWTSIAPVGRPSNVSLPGADSSDALRGLDEGWTHDETLRILTLKTRDDDAPRRVEITWELPLDAK